jgi:SAM-dependent methyltransferase
MPREVLLERLSIEPAGKRACVVRAGRGLLARELVRLGFAVAALDPDRDAARLGRETGARQRLAVDYEVGDAGRLPDADGSFDVGYWADTLEIAPQLDVVLAEAARAPPSGPRRPLRHRGPHRAESADLPGRPAVVALDAHHAARPLRLGSAAPPRGPRADAGPARPAQR